MKIAIPTTARRPEHSAVLGDPINRVIPARLGKFTLYEHVIRDQNRTMKSDTRTVYFYLLLSTRSSIKTNSKTQKLGKLCFSEQSKITLPANHSFLGSPTPQE